MPLRSGGAFGSEYMRGKVNLGSISIGVIDYALSFDGLDDYVNCGRKDVLNNVNNFTYLSWVYIPTTLWSEKLVIDKYDKYFYIVEDLSLHGFVSLDGLDAESYGNEMFLLKTWNYVGVTFSMVSKIIKLYLNGVECSYYYQSQGAGDPFDESPFDLKIGVRLSGILDEVCMYNRVLTLTEIQHNMHTKTPVLDGLVLWLPMNEGTGNIVYDKSGYGNNGTIYGATWVKK